MSEKVSGASELSSYLDPDGGWCRRDELSNDGNMPDSDEEFAEFDTDEATFDAMMGRADPAEIVDAVQTFTVEQVDHTTFTITMPAASFLSVATSRSTPNGRPIDHGPGRRRPHRSREVPEALAS
jgi:hypothetical protein